MDKKRWKTTHLRTICNEKNTAIRSPRRPIDRARWGAKMQRMSARMLLLAKYGRRHIGPHKRMLEMSNHQNKQLSENNTPAANASMQFTKSKDTHGSFWTMQDIRHGKQIHPNHHGCIHKVFRNRGNPKQRGNHSSRCGVH